MRTFSIYFSIGLGGIILAGCATTPRSPTPVTRPAVAAALKPAVAQAAYSAADTANEKELPAPRMLDTKSISAADGQALGLPELIGVTLERNPRLAQVGWAVETARGRAVQAGLYPNPTVNVTGNEISDRTGPGGIWPTYTSQEIVTADKLGLSLSAALAVRAHAS